MTARSMLRASVLVALAAAAAPALAAEADEIPIAPIVSGYYYVPPTGRYYYVPATAEYYITPITTGVERMAVEHMAMEEAGDQRASEVDPDRADSTPTEPAGG